MLMFFSIPAIPGALTRFEWLPPVWFLGLYYALQGKATPFLATTAVYAQWALLVSLVTAAVAYVLSYRVFLSSAAEQPDIVNRTLRLPAFVFRLADATVFRTPFERGTFRFILKTLFRSDRHIVILSGSLGLGAALAVQAALNPARGTPALFAVTLTIAYFLITALRFTYAVPSELRANWLFQSGVADPSPDPRAVARKVMLLAAMLFAVLPSTVICAIESGPAVALMHAAYVTLVCAGLAGMLLVGCRTIPFSCAFNTAGVNFALPLAGWFIGYVVFAFGLSGLEVFLMQRPLALSIFLAFGLFTWLVLRHLREETEPIVYEESPGTLELLRISE
jgi:hypothetical protein